MACSGWRLLSNTHGSKIDLFLGGEPDLFNGWVLSDLGHAVAYLLDLNVRPWTTKKRKQVVADICASLDVGQQGGEFKVLIARDNLQKELPSAMVRERYGKYYILESACKVERSTGGLEAAEALASSYDLGSLPRRFSDFTVGRQVPKEYVECIMRYLG